MGYKFDSIIPTPIRGDTLTNFAFIGFNFPSIVVLDLYIMDISSMVKL